MSGSIRPPAVFQTARLLARPPALEDAPSIFATYAGDPVATRYLSWKTYTTVEPLAAFLHTVAQNWLDPEARHVSWLLFNRETRGLVGSIGIVIEGGKMMCGYVFGRDHWGKGYATEALTWLADWGLAQPGLQRVWAFCDVGNPASARVMEKSGFAREGILRRWHVCPNIGPDLRDCIVCSRVR